MIGKTILCFILLYGYVGKSRNLSRTVISSRHYKNIPVHEEEFYTTVIVDARNVNEMQRSIALVDEDFDIPPKYNGIRESNGIFAEVEVGRTVEGSGDETIDISTKILNDSFSTENYTDFETKHTEVTNKTMSTPFMTEVIRSTTKTSSIATLITKITSTEEQDGSGDKIMQTKYSTEETITEIYLEPPDNCLNSSCDFNDLSIQLSESRNLIPEGINLTLVCSIKSSAKYNLYWYKNNGSTFYLQMSGKGKTLQFNIPDIKAFHSGTYKCVKWIKRQACCYTDLHLTVYEVPFYKYHLIILALVTAAAFLICIFLSVKYTVSLKIYKKQFEKNHGTLNHNLL